jgi:hypothetical protein
MTDVNRIAIEPAGPAPTQVEDCLRLRVLAHLRMQGFVVANGRVLAPLPNDKDGLRALHATSVDDHRERARKVLQPSEDLFFRKLARGATLDVQGIRPRLVHIDDRRSFNSHLWRWCALHWSIPVSAGYGRRLRFLVVDNANGKIIGVIGLGDPVFALAARDSWIGWSPELRRRNLANVMDAFVLGAVPPYSSLLGGKLVASLATSREVRDLFAAHYSHRRTLIAGRDPNARLAMVTTTSALGRSSVYNRLTGPAGQLLYQPVGYTSGSGDFHLAGPIYDELAAYVAKTNVVGSHAHVRWKARGPRNRREVIQRALEGIGLDSRQLRVHGIRRQVYVAPLLANVKEFLAGQAVEPIWINRGVDEISDWWLTRWATARAVRDDSWRDFDPRSWRLWPPS